MITMQSWMFLSSFENLRKNKISSTDNHIKFLASTFEMIIDIDNSENFTSKNGRCKTTL